MDVDGRNHF